MNNKFFFLFILAFTCLPIFQVYAQVDREFWFAVPKETDGHGNPNLTAVNNVSFKITALNLDAVVIVSMPSNPSFVADTFTVPKGQTYIKVLATTWAQFAAIYNNNGPIGSVPVTGKTNNGGFLITSTTDITVYYDFDNYYNRDLFSLKGRNALGTEFFTPFQNIWFNDSAGYNPDPYSTIDIVATEDNTDVTITPQPGQRFDGRPDDTPWTITLNRGEGYSVRAKYMSGRGHMSGVKITTSGGKKIAVTINDDSVRQAGPSCRDINGDQLVPTDIIGSKYLVMTGNKSNKNIAGALVPPYKYPNNIGEQIFVTATIPGTIINFIGMDGTILYQTPVLAAGKTDYMSVDITNANMSSIYIESTDPTKKFYTYHITGVGCELGGAILPPITDCTGSSEVSFYRSSTVNDITVNLMIPYDKTLAFTDPNQSHYHFKLIRYNGAVIDTITIPGTWFEANQTAGWAILKMSERDFNAETFTGRAHKIINTEDFFHLGMTNGTSGQTNKYGYFSSFNAATAEVYIPQNDEDNYIACYGEDIILVARNGLSYTWHYGKPDGPPLYLSDPKSPNPDVIDAPVGSHNFYVEVQQAKCFGTDTLKLNVVILPVVKAEFEVDNSAVCSPDTVTLKDNSDNADIYTWKKQVDSNPPSFLNFTAPNTERLFKERLNNPSSTTPQKITYTLIVESNQGCSDITSREITVYPRIEANFAMDDTMGCHPLPILFTNLSGGNTTDTTFFWNFGDQGSSNIKDPSHIYNNLGPDDTTYHITLIARSPYNCSDTALDSVIVHPYIFANYATDTIQGCSPLQIKIQNGSLGAISRYKWEYGNTDTSARSDNNYIYTYRNTGSIDSVFRLRLSVFNKAGCLDSMSRLITSYPEIFTDFLASVDTGCGPLPVTFQNLSNAAADSFYWNFGDGTSTYVRDPMHEYQNLSVKDTTFLVRLKATTSERCPGYDSTYIVVRGFIDPRFSLDTSQFCAPDTLAINNKSIAAPGSEFKWTFGDGSPDSISANPIIKHLYRNQTPIRLNLNLKLSLTGTGGCNKTLTKPIKIFPEIKADFSPDTAGCNPLPVQFRNLSTDMVAKSFVWIFNDSSSSVEPNPSHIFSHLKSTDQIYPVSLEAISEYNCRDTITKNITVYSYIDAKFAIDKGQGCSPLMVAITDSSEGGVLSKLWETGTTTIIGNLTNFEFGNTTGSIITQNLRLIVSSANCRDTFTRPIITYPEVNAEFILPSTDTIGCTPFKVDFELDPNWPYRNIIQNYRWEFGDNASSSNRTFETHTYDNVLSTEKQYTAKLLVYSAYNCVDSFQKNIYVYPFINPAIGIIDAYGCSPLTTSFTNGTSDGDFNFRWMLGDSIFPERTDRNPFSYTLHNSDSVPQDFPIRLSVNYKGYCQKDIDRSVLVYPLVKASFTEDTLKGCHPLTINFKNTSKNYTSSNWFFGDKGTSQLKEQPYTYDNYSYIEDSVYTVRLLATSEYACFDDTIKTVRVHPAPKAVFEVANSEFCPPIVLPVLNKSEGADTCFWNWGYTGGIDTTTSTGWIANPPTYNNVSNSVIWTYDINLRAKTIYNCESSSSQGINVFPSVYASFAPDDTSSCSPFLVPYRNLTTGAEFYNWTFGDSNTPFFIQHPTHTFFNYWLNDTTFDVQMIATSKFDCMDTAVGEVTVYPQPQASFTALPTLMTYPNATVDIKNQTNRGFWDWYWNFGDGRDSTVEEPLSHTYDDWGTKYITLTASSKNCTDSFTQSINILEPTPVPIIFASPNVCEGSATFQFTDSSLYAKAWFWEFDDGATSTEQNPEHTFLDPGVYQVKVTVTCENNKDYTYRTVTVYPKPLVTGPYQFSYNPSLVMLPDVSDGANTTRGKVTFENRSKYGTRFLWYFGDGQESSAPSPTHPYTKVGTYDVTQSVWTEFGCFDSITLPEAVTVISSGKVIFPNAFTPNPSSSNDGLYKLTDKDNDVFHPYWDGVIEFKMEIYDRWGEKLFESDNINKGWDGYYNGKLCKSDVYIYKAKGKFADGVEFNRVGDVTLIR